MVSKIKVLFWTKWVMRSVITVCVVYLAFFKQVKTHTEFEEMSQSDKDLIELEFKNKSHAYNDSVAKQERYEKINSIDSLHIDTIKQHILRTTR